MDYKQFLKFVEQAAAAHQEQAKTPDKAWREFNNGQKNPYFTHPLWCAMMIWLDTELPEKIRHDGILALLFHDVLEDTNAKLPKELSSEVRQLVQGMTYEGGFEQEQAAVLRKGPMVQLLKLYDKTATVYDAPGWLDENPEWVGFMKSLIETTKKKYGNLRIVTMAEALIKDRSSR